jgi:hypothetical protein
MLQEEEEFEKQMPTAKTQDLLSHKLRPNNVAKPHLLRACLFLAFSHIFISFWEIKKLDGLKSEKRESPF